MIGQSDDRLCFSHSAITLPMAMLITLSPGAFALLKCLDQQMSVISYTVPCTHDGISEAP